MFQFNNTRRDHTQVSLTDKQIKEIENRQKLAIILNAKEKIEDYKDKVFGIIDKKGLENDDNKTSLDTALKVLEYIIPKKKASEITINHKTIENIILEHVEEAKIIENSEEPVKTTKNEAIRSSRLNDNEAGNNNV